MNIGFDAKRITHNGTGLGNYSRFIVRILSEQFADNQYHLYSPSKGKVSLRSKVEKLPNVVLHYPSCFFYKMFGSMWRSGGLLPDLQRDEIQLFHGLSNEIPYGLHKKHIPSIVTIHDLIFMRFPQFYKPIDRRIYEKKFRRACLESDRIIAISEATKRDIIDFFGIEEQKISVVYQGCDPIFLQPVSKEEKQRIKNKYHLPEHYILNVGTIEYRKNLLSVVKAMTILQDQDIKLVAVGRKTPYTKEIEDYIQEKGLQSRIQLLHNVLWEDITAIYQSASLFVYPSLFEGFGIPIIEAIHSNLPVIAATGSCLEEAGGKASAYVDPENIEMLASSINAILSSPETIAKMIEESKTYVARFFDQQIAQELMSVYQQVI